jgi:hypothetical protein
MSKDPKYKEHKFYVCPGRLKNGDCPSNDNRICSFVCVGTTMEKALKMVNAFSIVKMQISNNNGKIRAKMKDPTEEDPVLFK